MGKVKVTQYKMMRPKQILITQLRWQKKWWAKDLQFCNKLIDNFVTVL